MILLIYHFENLHAYRFFVNKINGLSVISHSDCSGNINSEFNDFWLFEHHSHRILKVLT